MKVVTPVKDSTHHSVRSASPAPRQTVGRKSSMRRITFRGQRTAIMPAPYSSTTRRMFRQGPIYKCAVRGGFGILDEINMAKNESLAVLHASLDFRRIIDVPGYERIRLSPCTRFIATMNYGYAGTRELNEALASRFMVINMPIISQTLNLKYRHNKKRWFTFVPFADMSMKVTHYQKILSVHYVGTTQDILSKVKFKKYYFMYMKIKSTQMCAFLVT